MLLPLGPGEYFAAAVALLEVLLLAVTEVVVFQLRRFDYLLAESTVGQRLTSILNVVVHHRYLFEVRVHFVAVLADFYYLVFAIWARFQRYLEASGCCSGAVSTLL